MNRPPTACALRTHNPCPEIGQGGGQKTGQGLVQKSDIQETVIQETVINTVNGVVKGGEKGTLRELPDLGDPTEKTAYIANNVILQALGDEKSLKFYELVAAKIPEQVIREVLAEVRTDGARSPARLFTYKMQRYALEARKRGVFKAMGG